MLAQLERNHFKGATAHGELQALLAPADALSLETPHLIAKPSTRFDVSGNRFALPRYVFRGPQGGDDPIRIGIFAGIHGDEPAGASAAIQFLQWLARCPEIAEGYCLFIYPVCNPSGFVDGTRYSARGRDLNREFWNNSNEPEVLWLQTELWSHGFQGIISLHSDDTSEGMYGFVRGATLSKHLIEPALQAVEEVIPRNSQRFIDGFRARNGIIHRGYEGILSAPPGVHPKPFELILETPAKMPQALQEKAFLVALKTILDRYRPFMAYAPNL